MRNPAFRVLALGFVVTALASGFGHAAAAPKVVTSIKPVHSLVAGVMVGVGEPTLIIKGGGSPHSYSLRPSDARALSAADVVFWIGEDLETFLAKPLQALTGSAPVVALASSPGIELLQIREGGAWEGHDDDHGDPSEHEEHAAHEQHGDRDEQGAHNPHIWLDPGNAKQIVRAAVDALSRADPDNAGRYAANGAASAARIDRMDREISATLAPVKGVPYVVFHDAYPYFEAHYGTNAVGSISVSPDRVPGAKRLSEVRRKIVQANAACVFSEPQFQPALVRTVIEGTKAKTGVLDPLGAELDPGPDAYFQIMLGLAGSLRACLTPGS